jgi:hypothetical protein
VLLRRVRVRSLWSALTPSGAPALIRERPCEQPASLRAGACEKENAMPNGAERPEQGTTLRAPPPSIHRFLSQPIRSDVCHHSTETGICDQQRWMACHYLLWEQRNQ